jgi:putative membrane protein
MLCMNQQKKLIAGLISVCGITWVLAAIDPVDRSAWILENLLLVIFVIAISLTYRRLQVSSASWIFISLFVVLHIVGAHYTYARMPLGIWAKNFFGLARNDYDRVGHFAFGFLLAFPIREALLRFSGLRRAWSFCLPPAIILAAGGLFEILESIVTATFAPGEGADWLGAQGDEWDAQNDMLSALIGALVMMATVALTNRKKAPR